MTARHEVLFLAHRIPYPPDKGDKIRSWNVLRWMAARYDVHLAAFVDDPTDRAHEDVLGAICKSVSLIDLEPRVARLKSTGGLLKGEALSFAYYRDRRMSNAVAQIRARPLLFEYAYSSTMGQYLASAMGARPRIIDFCDADSEKFSAYVDTTAMPMRWVFAREGAKLKAAETSIVNDFDLSFAVSAEEAAQFNVRDGLYRSVEWFSNGVDTAHWNPDAPIACDAAPVDVVFAGAMDYRPNVEAANYFSSEIWPLIRERSPQARFAIVGARPERSLRLLDGKDGIVVTGRVDDVRPWLLQARVAVAPMKVARGVQNKLLEAMAMARPVVATSAAANGVVHEDGVDLFIADQPGNFAEQVCRLLEDPGHAAAIGAAARARMVREYQWPAQLARLQTRIDQLLDGAAGSMSSVA